MNIPNPITREYIRSLRGKVNFIYGDTIYLDGDGKQAQVARGEPNAFAVPVKARKCYNDVGAFFADYYLDSINKPCIDRSLLVIPETLPIIIFPKIGEGYNELPKRAPKTYWYLKNALMLKFGTLILNPEVLV